MQILPTTKHCLQIDSFTGWTTRWHTNLL